MLQLSWTLWMKGLLAITLCVMFFVTAIAALPDDVGRTATDVDFTWGVKIPVRLHHDEDHPSRLILPVVSGSSYVGFGRDLGVMFTDRFEAD
jgi:hypothetical protein